MLVAVEVPGDGTKTISIAREKDAWKNSTKVVGILSSSLDDVCRAKISCKKDVVPAYKKNGEKEKIW